ncbi:MAG: SMP-30/gluconolactonase/LRE family protein, partial [Bacteroidota bacterium]
VDTLAEGFNWSEGPLYIADGNYLLFSDVPENRVYKWSESEGIEVYLEPSGFTGEHNPNREIGSNGLLLSPAGELILLQHGDRRIAKMVSPISAPESVFATLADNYQGKRLNSPNDATLHSNGDLYFTDPPYGLDGLLEDPHKELVHQGVYRLQPNGQLDLLTTELRFPNGIALSPDQKTLYVASSDGANFIWMAYPVLEDGTLGEGKVFYDVNDQKGIHLGAPDGMKVNKAGYIFATGPGGIWIFHPRGEVLARIYTGQRTSNCALRSDEKYLFMTADDYLMGVSLK